MGEVKFCRSCGSPVMPQDAFCPECGQPIRRAATPGDQHAESSEDQHAATPRDQHAESGAPVAEAATAPQHQAVGATDHAPSSRRRRLALITALPVTLAVIAAALLLWPGHLLRSQNAASAASGPWRTVSAAAVNLQVPQAWKTSPPPKSDPTVRLVAYGPAQAGYPQTHLVLRADSTPAAASLTDAVTAYERIGKMRHPTQAWSPPKTISIPGAKTAVEVTGSFRLGDSPGGNLVHTLDIFAARDDGTPVHVYAVGSPDQISPDFVQRMSDSVSLRP